MHPLGLKGKRKGKLDKSKRKGKGKLFTKGKMTGGKGYPTGKGKDRPKCWNCGNYRHLSKDCKIVNAATEGYSDEDYGENEDYKTELEKKTGRTGLEPLLMSM